MKVKKILMVALVLTTTLIGASAQKNSDGKRNGEGGGNTVTETASAFEIARAAIASFGGEKFKNLKSLSLFGSADLYYGANPNRVTSGKFALVQAGDRARVDIETPDMSYREIYDGKRPYGSVSPASVWPPKKFGLPVLARFDQTGYSVTPLPDQNQPGFRITDSEGYATDFLVDQATGRVKQYSFDFNNIKHLIEHKSFKEVDGVLVPYSFLRKMSLPRVDVYMEFKVKEAKINQPVGDDVFIIPER